LTRSEDETRTRQDGWLFDILTGIEDFLIEHGIRPAAESDSDSSD
jgi:hypothetical protein